MNKVNKTLELQEEDAKIFEKNPSFERQPIPLRKLYNAVENSAKYEDLLMFDDYYRHVAQMRREYANSYTKHFQKYGESSSKYKVSARNLRPLLSK